MPHRRTPAHARRAPADSVDLSCSVLRIQVGVASAHGKDAKQAGALTLPHLCCGETFNMKSAERIAEARQDGEIVIHGTRCALGPQETVDASIEIVDGRISRIKDGASCS